MTAPDRSLIAFACETELAVNHRRLKDSLDPIMIKATLAFLLSRQTLSYAAESRLIFWNLLFTMLLSSLLLLSYLKKILFDF